jgi:hypothetical protein
MLRWQSVSNKVELSYLDQRTPNNTTKMQDITLKYEKQYMAIYALRVE